MFKRIIEKIIARKFYVISAEIAAQNATQVLLRKEIPKINKLIAKASKKGETKIKINSLAYSEATKILLKNAGYTLDGDYISWIGSAMKLEHDEIKLMKIANKAKVEILKVQ